MRYRHVQASSPSFHHTPLHPLVHYSSSHFLILAIGLAKHSLPTTHPLDCNLGQSYESRTYSPYRQGHKLVCASVCLALDLDQKRRWRSGNRELGLLRVLFAPSYPAPAPPSKTRLFSPMMTTRRLAFASCIAPYLGDEISTYGRVVVIHRCIPMNSIVPGSNFLFVYVDSGGSVCLLLTLGDVTRGNTRVPRSCKLKLGINR